jgi:hypothetical protein
MPLLYGAIIPMKVYTIKQVERCFKRENIDIKNWDKVKIYREYLLKHYDDVYANVGEGYYDSVIHGDDVDKMIFLISCNIFSELPDLPVIIINDLSHVFIGWEIAMTNKLISLNQLNTTDNMKKLRENLDKYGFEEFATDYHFNSGDLGLDTEVDDMVKI